MTARTGIRCVAIFHALLALALVGACSSLPKDYPRTSSTAIDAWQATSLGAHFAPLEAAHPGKSGFDILRYGRNAFSLRLAIIEMAEESIDLQVYIWASDETGWIMAERLIQAADRGVRVRLLIDDLGFGGSDEGIASMDAHPNIEVRLFNPFANRDSTALDFVFDLDRVNHRMHNKIIIADNSVAVIGGRNIGNNYFSVDPQTNFRDLDIIAAGPIVRDTSTVFDHFWQIEAAVPVPVLLDRTFTTDDLRALSQELRSLLDEGNYPYAIDQDIAVALKEIAVAEEKLIWAPGSIIWDHPEKTLAAEENAQVITGFMRQLQTVTRSLTIESAYFVVQDRGVEALKQLVERGVAVRVLTNSLVSNDVLAAHAGHATYRKQLLQAGVAVYELRPDSAVIRKNWQGEPSAGLHTKTFVFDNESLFIGSFNLDPRSANINTEAGAYVESPELSARLLAHMDEGVLPENSYRVTLDEDGNLLWTTVIDGVEVTFDKDPLSTFGQRFMSGFISILPVHSQL